MKEISQKVEKETKDCTIEKIKTSILGETG